MHTVKMTTHKPDLYMSLLIRSGVDLFSLLDKELSRIEDKIKSLSDTFSLQDTDLESVVVLLGALDACNRSNHSSGETCSNRGVEISHRIHSQNGVFEKADSPSAATDLHSRIVDVLNTLLGQDHRQFTSVYDGNTKTFFLRLFELSYPHSSESCQQHVQETCLKMLNNYSLHGEGNENETNDGLDVHLAISLVYRILSSNPLVPAAQSWLDEMFSCTEKLIISEDEEVVGKLLSMVVPELLKRAKSTALDQRLLQMWTAINKLYGLYGQKTYQSTSCSSMSGRPHLILCGLADWFFPVETGGQLHPIVSEVPEFWKIIQAGFYNINPLTRKRALYILKRTIDITETTAIEVKYCADYANSTDNVPVFHWKQDTSKKQAELWQDYILLLETLEEKQVHVIKPLMPRLGGLIAACKPQEDGSVLLHTSWVCTLIQRMSCHESSYIKRMGTTEMLSIDMTTFPLLQQYEEEFICGALVAMLTEPLVYYKPPESPLGECPLAACLLKTFLRSCIEALADSQRKATFLEGFIHGLLDQQWGGSALVHVTRALAELPRLSVCRANILIDIRDLLSACLTNLDVHMRGGAQCLLATAVTKLLDTDSAEPKDLLPLLSLLRADESLCRGTSLWTEFITWLKDVASKSPKWSPIKLRQSIRDQLDGYMSMKSGPNGSCLNTPTEVRGLVRLMLLVVDAGLMPGLPEDGRRAPLIALLTPAVDILLAVNSHAYMSTTKADRALTLFTILIQEIHYGISSDDDVVKKVQRVAAECSADIILYILRTIANEINGLEDVDRVSLYKDSLRTLVKAGVDVHACPHTADLTVLMKTGFSQASLEQPSLQAQMRRYAAVTTLGCLAALAPTTTPPAHAFTKLLTDQCQRVQPVHQFARPTTTGSESASDGHRGHGSSTWGRVTAGYIVGQWECLRLGLRHEGSTYSLPDLTAWCQDALDVTSGRTIIPIVQCVKGFISKVQPSVAKDLIQLMWRKVKEESRNTLSFWPCLDAFVDTLCLPELLLTQDVQLSEALLELMSDFFDMGQEKQGLVNVLVGRLCLLWGSHADRVSLINKHIDIILSAIMFGPIHDKSKRHHQETLAFLSSLGDSLAINQLKNIHARSECLVRAMVLSILSRLDPQSAAEVSFAHKLLDLLADQHRLMNECKTYRSYSNSLPHRHKHRIMVATNLLEPFIYKGVVEKTISHLLESLVQENQPSVRLMVEWLMVRVILKEITVLDMVVKEIENKNNNHMAYLCSLFAVVTRVAKFTDSDNQEALMMQVLPAVLPWCTMHQFNCRTFAQASVLVLWTTCKERQLHRVLTAHSVIEKVVDFQLHNINQSKGTSSLLDHFFFHFDPFLDYSMEALTWTVPRLTLVVDEEWISPDVFRVADPGWAEAASAYSLPLVSKRDTLNVCKPGTWKIKITEPQDFHAADGNVQKKIIPWMSMLPRENLEDGLTDDLLAKQKREGKLVLVASLIEKVPNLGGLCRTSEIFGVSEYVIGNLKYVKAHEFESLSVTAHKWIPITEVRPHLLRKYMLQMKAAGYTLVGAEQTTDSVSLRDYTFPEKTLLLLGNEREGIPVDLIQLLDVCVEIPQQGVVRSLNVHVSGALLVWEYTRQQLSAKM